MAFLDSIRGFVLSRDSFRTYALRHRQADGSGQQQGKGQGLAQSQLPVGKEKNN